MDSKNGLPPAEELWEMVKTFSQHANDLKASLEVERRKNTELDSENAGWLIVYQKLQSQIGVLEAELSQIRSRTSDRQDNPRS